MNDERTPKVYFNNVHRVFFARWRENGKYRTKQVPCDVTDKDTATKWVERWWEQYTNTRDLHVTPPPETKCIRTLYPQWVEYVGSRKEAHPDDRGNAERPMRLHVCPYPFADIPFDRMKLSDCVDWIAELKRTGLAPYSVRNVVQAVRTFFSDARGRGWIDCENFFLDPYVKKQLKKPEPVAGKGVIVALSLEETLRILSYGGHEVPANRHAKNVLAVTTGLRAGELCGLRWGDIDLNGKHPALDVERQLVRHHSKKGAPVFRDPKKGSFRTIPLHTVAVEALKEWRSLWPAFVGRKPTDDDAVFPDPDGDFVYTWHHADLFRRDLCVYDVKPFFPARNGKLVEKTYHCLRRTFLTLLTDAGVQDADVKALAGHADPGVTRGNYVRKNLPRFAGEVAKLPFSTSTLTKEAAA